MRKVFREPWESFAGRRRVGLRAVVRLSPSQRVEQHKARTRRSRDTGMLVITNLHQLDERLLDRVLAAAAENAVLEDVRDTCGEDTTMREGTLESPDEGTDTSTSINCASSREAKIARLHFTGAAARGADRARSDPKTRLLHIHIEESPDAPMATPRPAGTHVQAWQNRRGGLRRLTHPSSWTAGS